MKFMMSRRSVTFRPFPGAESASLPAFAWKAASAALRGKAASVWIEVRDSEQPTPEVSKFRLPYK